jgi:hypothetical protein
MRFRHGVRASASQHVCVELALAAKAPGISARCVHDSAGVRFRRAPRIARLLGGRRSDARVRVECSARGYDQRGMETLGRAEQPSMIAGVPLV